MFTFCAVVFDANHVSVSDAFMATELATLGIDREHDVRVFSAKTKSLQEFCNFLRDYLKSVFPANRPSISVFVLPSQSVKQNAFKLFFDLGAAARRFGVNEYAEIYGFDDGMMPRYKLRQKLEVPFFGLQEVHRIELKPGTTIEGIQKICREHCKSDYFVLIDEYRPVKELFLVKAAMEAEAGIQTTEGWCIYAKKG